MASKTYDREKTNASAKCLYEMDRRKDEDIVNFAVSQWDTREQRYCGLYRDWSETIAAYRGYLHYNYEGALSNFLGKLGPVPSWRVNLAINLALPRVRTFVAKMLKSRPTFDVIPATSSIKDVEIATLGKKTLQGVWYQQNFNFKFMDMLLQLALTGNAWSYPYWNPFSGKVIDLTPESFLNQENLMKALQLQDETLLEVVFAQAQTDFEKFKQKNRGDPGIFIGEVGWDIVSPFDVITDDCGSSDKMEWLVMAQVTSKSFYENIDIDTEEMWLASETDIRYQKMSNQFDMMSIFEQAAPSGISPAGYADDKILELHLWLPTSNRDKRGFWAVIAGGKVIRKGPNPYLHQRVPLINVCADKLPNRMLGFSHIAQALPQMRSYNRAKSTIIEVAQLMSKPHWTVPKTARLDKPITSAPGQLIHYHGSTPPKIEQGADIPRAFVEIMGSDIRDIDEITSQREPTRGQNVPGGRAAATLQNLQSVDDGNLAPMGLQLDTVMSCTGRMLLSIITQFYTEDRMVSYLGDKNKHIAYTIKQGQLQGKNVNLPGVDYHNVRVTTFTQFGLDRAGQQATLETFLQYNVFGPEDRERILKWIDMGWFEDEIDQWKNDRSIASQENFMMGQTGQLIPPTIEQNHQIHLEEHKEFCNTDDFRRLQPAAKEILRQHIYLTEFNIVLNHVKPQVMIQAAQLVAAQEFKGRTGIDILQISQAMGAMNNARGQSNNGNNGQQGNGNQGKPAESKAPVRS